MQRWILCSASLPTNFYVTSDPSFTIFVDDDNVACTFLLANKSEVRATLQSLESQQIQFLIGVSMVALIAGMQNPPSYLATSSFVLTHKETKLESVPTTLLEL